MHCLTNKKDKRMVRNGQNSQSGLLRSDFDICFLNGLIYVHKKLMDRQTDGQADAQNAEVAYMIFHKNIFMITFF